MAWAAIDDNMPHHPKVMALTDREFRAWVCSLAWAQRYKTRGHIPEHALDGIPRADKKTAGRLVALGLWDENDDGWVIHDWETYNPDAITRKKRDADRKRASRGSVNGTETERTETTTDA